jgi:pyruvate dehydrogenase E2 component (dihydrolipoamide acetyltransferase)
MPQVSNTSAEVKLISWLKKPGDPVKRGDPLMEVETDKATVEVESYVDGYFRVANYADGATIALDAVIAILTTTADEIMDDLPVELPHAEVTQRLQALESTGTPEAASVKKGRVEITPVARRLAEDNHLDINALSGSGPQGRIVRTDVESALKSRQLPSIKEMKTSPPPAIPHEGAGLSSMRNAIAQRTTVSKLTIPHYYLSIDINMKVVINLLANLKKVAAEHKTEAPTITDMVIWVCGKILPKFPLLYGTWTEKGPSLNPEINIGMVVGLEEGLIVPIVHNVDQMNLSTLPQATRDLKQRARLGHLNSRELTGGTFTVSNLGMYGISSFIAVINPPECAILALGAISKCAVVDEREEVVVRPMMTATLSVDHRMIDGILAAKFLSALRETLEEPSVLLFDH